MIFLIAIFTTCALTQSAMMLARLAVHARPVRHDADSDLRLCSTATWRPQRGQDSVLQCCVSVFVSHYAQLLILLVLNSIRSPELGRSLFPTNRGWLWVPDGDSCVTASCESCCSCGSWKRVSLSNYVATQSSSLLRSSLFLLHKPVANHHYTLAKPPKLPTGSLWILANTWLCLAASVFSPGLLLWPIININCIDCRRLSLSLWPGCAG